jgi:hypothetical protein
MKKILEFDDNMDFNLVFSESQNENVPTLLNPGLVLTSGQKMKSGDINKDGKITISDTYLLGANLTGLITYNEVFWYTSSNFNSMTISNFNSFTPVDYFIINFTTTPVILDIKYIVKGDADLSSSSN